MGVSLTELAEEYGGEEGAQRCLDKGDAQEACIQVFIALWNEEGKAVCEKYSKLMDEAGEHEAQLRSLTDHQHISVQLCTTD